MLQGFINCFKQQERSKIVNQLATYALIQLPSFSCPHDLMQHVRLTFQKNQKSSNYNQQQQVIQQQIQDLKKQIQRLGNFLLQKNDRQKISLNNQQIKKQPVNQMTGRSSKVSRQHPYFTKHHLDDTNIKDIMRSQAQIFQYQKLQLQLAQTQANKKKKQMQIKEQQRMKSGQNKKIPQPIKKNQKQTAHRQIIQSLNILHQQQQSQLKAFRKQIKEQLDGVPKQKLQRTVSNKPRMFKKKVQSKIKEQIRRDKLNKINQHQQQFSSYIGPRSSDLNQEFSKFRIPQATIKSSSSSSNFSLFQPF